MYPSCTYPTYHPHHPSDPPSFHLYHFPCAWSLIHIAISISFLFIFIPILPFFMLMVSTANYFFYPHIHHFQLHPVIHLATPHILHNTDAYTHFPYPLNHLSLIISLHPHTHDLTHILYLSCIYPFNQPLNSFLSLNHFSIPTTYQYLHLSLQSLFHSYPFS